MKARRLHGFSVLFAFGNLLKRNSKTIQDKASNHLKALVDEARNLEN
jgi:hypothetical protein